MFVLFRLNFFIFHTFAIFAYFVRNPSKPKFKHETYKFEPACILLFDLSTSYTKLTCGDLRGPAGTCGDLRGPTGTCGDMRANWHYFHKNQTFFQRFEVRSDLLKFHQNLTKRCPHKKRNIYFIDISQNTCFSIGATL